MIAAAGERDPMPKTTVTALLALAACTAASAAPADFAGAWRNANPAAQDISRLAIAASGKSITVQVFAPCERGLCDWGKAEAHGYSLSVTSADVRIVTADFDLDRRQAHLILRLAPGGLDYRLFTDFADATARMDTESGGFLKKPAPQPGDKP
jgi:hypothetical protein